MFCKICKYNNHKTEDCYWRERGENVIKCEIGKLSNHKTEECYWNGKYKTNVGNVKKKVI